METKMNTEEEKSMIEVLPEDCIAKILSHTTPTDSCRLSLVSKGFCSASESDIVWDKFLPSDLVSIISDSQSTSLLLDPSLSKKSLYLTLSDYPIFIDNDKKSFQLEKKSGKKGYMLGARDLTVICDDNTLDHCDRISLSNSRFQEVIRLRSVSWFEICGTINKCDLSANSQYAVFIVFKIDKDLVYEFPVDLTVGIPGKYSCTKFIWCNRENVTGEIDDMFQEPKLRSDGFFEVEMGFFNSKLEDEVFETVVLIIRGHRVKKDFIFEGIEVRPKN